MDIDEAGRSIVSEEAEKELTRLWRTWRTVNEMLMDRVWNAPSLAPKRSVY